MVTPDITDQLRRAESIVAWSGVPDQLNTHIYTVHAYELHVFHLVIYIVNLYADNSIIIILCTNMAVSPSSHCSGPTYKEWTLLKLLVGSNVFALFMHLTPHKSYLR